MNQKTYGEGGKYYAVIFIRPNGPNYYKGPYNCRSTAYRHSLKENRLHQQAQKSGMIYNTKAM